MLRLVHGHRCYRLGRVDAHHVHGDLPEGVVRRRWAHPGPRAEEIAPPVAAARSPSPTAASGAAPPPPPQSFPWGVAAPETEALQETLNTKLAQDGLCLIGTDGKLGAKTCGAAQHYGAAPPSCQAFTKPIACPGGSGGGGGGGGGAPPEDKASLLGLALAGGAAAVGMWFLLRRR